MAIGFGLLTCAALSPHSLLNRLRIPGATSRGIDPKTPLIIAAVMGVEVLGGWILYKLVKTPFMRLRARWYPTDASKNYITSASTFPLTGSVVKLDRRFDR